MSAVDLSQIKAEAGRSADDPIEELQP